MLVLEGSKALEIIRVIADEYSRKIVLIGASRPFEIEELNSQSDIPLSTCYRRVRYLESAGILKIDKVIFLEDGRKKIYYRTSFNKASICFDSGELTVELTSSKDLSEGHKVVREGLRISDNDVDNTVLNSTSKNLLYFP